jgi:hypothetical protein
MFESHYQIQNSRFSISSPCRKLKSGLASLYPALLTKPGKCFAKWRIEDKYSMKTGSLTYLTFEDETLIYQTQDIGHLLDDLEWRITMRILKRLGRFVQIHAAGLVTEGKALLVVGPSGAGKSSLAVSLLLRGWKCLSDEIILIDPASETAWPFPRSFRIDIKTLRLLPGLGIIDTGNVYMDNMGKRRLDPAFVMSDWVAEPSMPGWMIFPNYHPNNRGDLTPIGETEALTLLLSQAINLVDHGERGLDSLTRLVRRVQCLRLDVGDMNDATSQLVRLTQRDQRSICLSGPPAEYMFQRAS